MSGVKSRNSISELHLRLFCLSVIWDSGIPSVGVKSVDIRKNTRGEDGYLGHF